MAKTELVVLVDSRDRPIGTCPKHLVHHNNTPLHRAFSIFLFNGKGETLVTQRAKSKNTWPGVWSNSVCGHPFPGENRRRAIRRRVKEELGVEIEGLMKVAPYRYRFERNGVVENEICPVYVGKVVGEVKRNPREVEDFEWMSWKEFKDELKRDKHDAWSEWSKEEVTLVERFLFA
jgi:isopentenyl-diphosphate Delta-isomerase